MHQGYKALRLNCRTVFQTDVSAAGSLFQRGFNPGNEISKVQLHLDLYLLGQCRELSTEQSRDADGTIVAPDTLCPVLHIQLHALQRIGDVVVQTTGSLDE